MKKTFSFFLSWIWNLELGVFCLGVTFNKVYLISHCSLCILFNSMRMIISLCVYNLVSTLILFKVQVNAIDLNRNAKDLFGDALLKVNRNGREICLNAGYFPKKEKEDYHEIFKRVSLLPHL